MSSLCSCGAPLLRGTADLSCPACEVSLIFDDLFFKETTFPEIDGFEIGEVLGRGGMGVVYRAQSSEPPRREVAIKVIRADLRQAAAHERFQSEIDTLAKINHPLVCQILTAGQTRQGEAFYIMEYVEGETLARHLENRGSSLDQQSRMDLALALCEAVQACHSAGVIHRDLSPANILVTADGKPKLLDFGVAAVLNGGDGPGLGGQSGTPGFMSSEQIRGDEVVGMESDVFVTALWIARIFGQEFPFSRSNDKVMEEEPVLLRKILGRDLESVLRKALDKDRARRYRSAGELAIDLEKTRDHQPVSARPLTLVYFGRKWIRRHRGGLSVALVVLGLLMSLAMKAKMDRLASEKQIERERIASLTQDLVRSAEAKGVRGDWAGAVRDLELALERGHPDPAQVHLFMVEAALAADRKDLARKHLALVEGNSAGVSYWAAHLTSDEEEAVALLEESLRGDLPLPQQYIARSLLSDSTLESIRLLKKSLEIKPRSQQAIILLCSHQLWTDSFGEAFERIESARYLFPNDPQLDVLYLMASGILGEDNKSEVIKEVRERHGEALAAQMETMQRGLGTWSILYDTYAGTVPPAKMLGFQKLFASGVSMMAKGPARFSPLSRKIIEKAFPDGPALIRMLFMAPGIPQIRQFLEDEMARELPRDSMLTVGLMKYFDKVGNGFEEQEHIVFFDRACAACNDASRIPATKAIALELQAIAHFIAGLKKREPHVGKAREAVLARYQVPITICERSAELFYKGAVRHQLEELEEQVIGERKDSLPGNGRWILRQSDLEAKRGHYFAAIKTLEALSSPTRRGPDGIEERRKAILKKISERIRQLGSAQ